MITKLNKHLRSRHRYTKEERDEIFEADRVPGTLFALCRYCHRPVYKNEEPPWHVAHEIPWSKFGSNARWNVGVAHAKCNMEAGNKTMKIYQMLSVRTLMELIVVGLLLLSIYLLWR